MNTLRFKTITFLVCAAAGIGCGGSDGPGGSSGPAPAVLTTVEVTPANAEIYTLPPGNIVGLTVVGKDQNGQPMSNIGAASFSSQNAAVASVAGNGTVTAAAAGVAQVTASVTAGGVTKSGVTSVTVRVAPAAATVTAPAFVFVPGIADISAGGAVTWSIGDIHHNVTFTTAGAPADIAELRNQSDSRTFTSPGTFAYFCGFHAGMNGTIRVH